VCGKAYLTASPLVKQVRNSSSFFVVDFIQNGLMYTHDNLGLPWWAVFSSCTIGARLLLFPLVGAQLVQGATLRKAIPQINSLTTMYKTKLLSRNASNQSGHESVSPVALTSMYLKGVRATLTLFEVSLFKLFAPVMLNMSLFISFVYSIRQFIFENSSSQFGAGSSSSSSSVPDVDAVVGNMYGIDVPELSMPIQIPALTPPMSPSIGLDTGGLLWFQDLSICDPTYVLPVASVFMSYLGVTLAFQNTDKAHPGGQNSIKLSTLPGPMVYLKEFILTALLLSVPFITQLPAGVFMYWIPNSCFSISQSMLLRNPKFRSKIGA